MWIGFGVWRDMSWPTVGLLEVASISAKLVDPKDSRYAGMPLIAPDHVESETGRILAFQSAQAQEAISGKYLVEPADVIYSKIRPYLMKVAIPGREVLCSADMYPVQCGEKILPEYLKQVLLGNPFTQFAISCSNRTGIPKVNREELAQFRFRLPNLETQKSISSKANDWAGAIATTNALLGVLERRKQGLMQQLLTGRRRLKGFKGKWKLLRADKLFTEISVRKQTADEALLSVTQDRGVIPRDMLVGRVTMPAGAVDAFKLVERDNFVISLRSFQGGLEHSAYRGLVSPAYTVLQASEDIHPAFFRHYFKSTDFVKRLSVAVVGIRDGKQISYTDFRSIKLPLPPMAEQQSLTELLDLAEQDIALCRERLEELQRQKRALMQKLLSGEWRLPEAPTQNKPASKKGLQPPNNVRK